MYSIPFHSTGTPGIFRDFGFVEQSVQLWPFLDHNIYFELEFDDETGEEEHFGFDEDGNGNYRYGKPDEEGLRFLQEQLERLEGISDDLKERPEDIPEYQWENIKLFYTDMLRAIRRVTEETIKLNNSDEL